ncbi:HNH endonuclease [Agrobacterium tumefaciens]|uniref:HNH endonuclease n=1 Tax=Agrobacterium tumefaciens TaxID=358 RepID=UPI001572F3E7|nr:HNH endonuclease signature motif containing protein [Agrobacterium tumefaciens]NSZ00648.1 HNH endonuclease [Agrobacterium tumefaciens]NSZ38142.1 HNH endonuclease [Agrobacterium tumefaciens]NTB25611.1 HNH endonuclease [Agrobacterium tumefaciens]NTB27046.1 HNH endonuclease [Agrobacterium tumefaciens]NTB32328.1 HNH endonuclease [Agrobacterium tumefaciens]
MRRSGLMYFEARGFSTYYVANVLFNIVKHPTPFLRGIEEILGDMKTEFLMSPFKKYTNLHEFIRCIWMDILLEAPDDGAMNSGYIKQFLDAFDVVHKEAIFESEDAFLSFMDENQSFHEALDDMTDEVFHILFTDVAFLQAFNRLCSGYIKDYSEACDGGSGYLKRVSIPKWARRAIFYRDRGECRACKRNLTGLVTTFDTDCYDHIVPLASFGANDVTNLQLLCEPCNLLKSSRDVAVSKKYQRVIPRP